MISLAYVFWHQPRQDVDGEAYERVVRSFHNALHAGYPDGFRSSHVFRHLSLPWASADAAVYEDWYVLDGFGALGAINESAVSGSRKTSHDEAARMAEWGAGGVYGLVHGEPWPAVRFAYWLAKPAGWTYDRFLGVIKAAPIAAIWQRQMVLGPAPEFCILSSAQLELELPNVLVSSPTLVWPQKDNPE